jgi:citrate synthase
MSYANDRYRPGLEGVVAAQTAISSVDGEKGKLVIRGFAVEDLAPPLPWSAMLKNVLPAQRTPH